jgi:hypothetical protein
MPIVVADIALNHPRASLVHQLLDLARREVISKQELYGLRYVIEKEWPARFADPAVQACTWQLDGGRDVRVHRYNEADAARWHGEVVVEKRADHATPGQIVHARATKLRKDDPTLSEDAAQAQVFREDPELYWQYRHSVAHQGAPYPQPVAKAAPSPMRTSARKPSGSRRRRQG